jgi:hypothetical protein
MTRTLILVALLALPGSAFAQTVERTIDLSQFGWGKVSATPVNADGNPATEEWLIQSRDSLNPRYRVVAVRNGGLCVGEWFNPIPEGQFGTHPVLGRIGNRDVLVINSAALFAPTSALTIVSLDTPQCK